MSFQPPPPGNPPPPPPEGWQQPPGGSAPPPPPPTPGFGGPPPGAGPPPPPPPYGTPPPAAVPPWGPGGAGEAAFGQAPEPPKKSRKGLFIGLGVAAAVVLLLLVVGLATVADKLGGGTALADLKRGDCFNTSKALVADKATRVDCSEPHGDEVAAVLTFPAGDDASYPGQNGIVEFGTQDCPQQVAEFYGSKEVAPTTQIFIFGPDEAGWKNGDRTVVCTLREQNAAKRTGSYLDG